MGHSGRVVMASGWVSEGQGTKPGTYGQPLTPDSLKTTNILGPSVPLMI